MLVKKSRKSFKNKTMEKRMRRKTRRNTRRKHMKLKGGNFGGNCPDPNYSIYNTNLLKLFPYSTFGKG